MLQSPTELVPLDSALPPDFIDWDGKGPNARPADTLLNSLIALNKLDLDCSYNIFRNEFLISGQLLTLSLVGELSDNAVLGVRELIARNFEFEPSSRMMQDAIKR